MTSQTFPVDNAKSKSVIRKLRIFFSILVTVWINAFPSYVRITKKVMEQKFIRQKMVRILDEVLGYLAKYIRILGKIY